MDRLSEFAMDWLFYILYETNEMTIRYNKHSEA